MKETKSGVYPRPLGETGKRINERTLGIDFAYQDKNKTVPETKMTGLAMLLTGRMKSVSSKTGHELN